MATGVTKRSTGQPTVSATKNAITLGSDGTQFEPGDVWAGTWGTTWGNTWGGYSTTVFTEASPALMQTKRSTGTPAQSITKRV